MELEEGKESMTGSLALQNLFENIKTVEEAKYLLDRLCGATITQTCNEALIASRLTEKEALLEEVQQDSNIQQQLLQHVLAQTPTTTFPDTGPFNIPSNMTGSVTSIGSGNTVIIPYEESMLNQLEDRNFHNQTSSAGSSRSPSPANSNLCEP